MGRIALALVSGAVILFLIGPLLIVVAGSFTTTSYLTFPPQGFTLHWYRELLKRPDMLEGFFVSIAVAGAAGIVSTSMGTLAALALNRGDGFAREWLRAFVISPLILPTVVTGVALYTFVQQEFPTSAYVSLIIGHTIITVPYAVRTVGSALVSLDPALPEAASGLGASWLRTLVEVILPAILPAIFVSVVLVFIVSFDAVSISIFLAEPGVSPLPVQLYNYVQFALDPMVAAVSALMILFAYAVVVILERLFGLDRAFSKG